MKISHDVAESLQIKIEGLKDVERAFVHVDWEHDHHVHGEHKPVVVKMDKARKAKGIRGFFGLAVKEKQDAETQVGTTPS